MKYDPNLHMDETSEKSYQMFKENSEVISSNEQAYDFMQQLEDGPDPSPPPLDFCAKPASRLRISLSSGNTPSLPADFPQDWFARSTDFNTHSLIAYHAFAVANLLIELFQSEKFLDQLVFKPTESDNVLRSSIRELLCVPKWIQINLKEPDALLLLTFKSLTTVMSLPISKSENCIEI
ncbi:hypothetical protein DAPPUDRAFT_251531 [Daphnia pulex]|uniref:Uncharacterized protein n=1 Tax=Daphnia pulex TaxID=6669 RepID=E9H0L9_DAPPU|nr:hypothetical protein DAPPUDRAFT_251531 [Daphnia pulex]|eukprot:EFX74729.1 hypothetical protein DAPPUDRAFT_251531 [Daphnia pulex]